MFVQNVEQGLLEQIAYLNEVSTTHAHEGSAYGEEKVRIKENKYQRSISNLSI